MKKSHAATILFIFFILSDLASLRAQDNSNFPSPIGLEAFEVMRQFFNYDQQIPLDANIVERIDEPNYVKEKLVFSGPGNSRVPGYLAIPKTGTAPYPCVLQLHGIGDSKNGWWQDDSFVSGMLLTRQLLEAGFAVLSLDAEYHGERLANNNFESANVFTFQKGWFLRARDMIVQSATEYRRAIDYLGSRKEIDTSRIGMIGYSMGGMMTFNVAAVDNRIKASVACVTPILKEPFSAMNVYNFAPYLRSQSFLMLMGTTDERNYTKEDAQKLHQLIPIANKELVFYESGHQLPKEWTTKATVFMKKNLK